MEYTMYDFVYKLTSNVGVVSGFGAVWFRRSMPTFRRNMLSLVTSALKMETACFFQPYFVKYYISPLLRSLITSDLKMETACFSETLASTYETTRCQTLRLHQHYNIRSKNLKSGQ
jgi:hypothetical protein